MGILVALIGVAIIAAVVVASFTAVLGGVIGGELEDEEEAVERWTDLWELGQLRRNRFANIWKNGTNGSGCFIRKDLLDRWQGWHTARSMVLPN